MSGRGVKLFVFSFFLCYNRSILKMEGVFNLSHTTRAYILIEALPGKAMELVNLAKAMTGVKTVHLVTGPYDVIAFTEAADLKALGELIVKKIQATGCVARTLTCILVEE